MTIKEWAEDFKSYVNALDMPRDDYNGIMEYIDDAVVLLKEQEVVEPVLDIDTLTCGNCNHPLEHDYLVAQNVLYHDRYNYCPYCGKKVKWND